MDTNCAPFLANLSLYSYGADSIQNILEEEKKGLDGSVNFIFRYIDDALSFNNQDFDKYLKIINLHELDINDTLKTDTYASYLI